MPIDKFLYTKLRDYLPHEPTKTQDTLLKELAKFITEPANEEVFLLTGYAGTGKTTVVAALVKLLEEMQIDSLLLAPTGRAAKVVSGYAGKSAYTIHRKIYRQQVHHDPASRFVLAPNEFSNTIFIVDEASMISNEDQGSIFGSGRLLDDLVQFVCGGSFCKLIMVGDSAQLPPVKSPLSPALEERSYNNTIAVNLSEVVRQSSESGILHNATLIRNNIEKNQASIPVMQLKGFHDIENITGAEVLDKLTEAYDKYGEHETMVICRSNKRANIYNRGIRSQLLFREDELTRGDRIMVVKNCYQFVDEVENIDFIANGDIAELVSVRRYEDKYGFHFARAELRFPDYDNAEVTAKIVLDTLHLETAALDADRQKQFYEAVYDSYSNITTKRARNKAVREDLYFNALQIRYANAVTCHKAQGGQWKAIFLDYPFRKGISPAIEDLRWLYTAFTRATKHLYLVNFDSAFLSQ
jgi:exodeoxyribonuclease-5